jgi:membrane-associated HD superfamily phosphohydrolase
MEVQEIEQETMQNGREPRPQASNELIFQHVLEGGGNFKKLTLPKPSLSLIDHIVSSPPTTIP